MSDYNRDTGILSTYSPTPSLSSYSSLILCIYLSHSPRRKKKILIAMFVILEVKKFKAHQVFGVEKNRKFETNFA
jgi:hypothetical protein